MTKSLAQPSTEKVPAEQREARAPAARARVEDALARGSACQMKEIYCYRWSTCCGFLQDFWKTTTRMFLEMISMAKVRFGQVGWYSSPATIAADPNQLPSSATASRLLLAPPTAMSCFGSNRCPHIAVAHSSGSLPVVESLAIDVQVRS